MRNDQGDTVTPCEPWHQARPTAKISIHSLMPKKLSRKAVSAGLAYSSCWRDPRLRSSCYPVWLINRCIIPAIANGAILSTCEENHPIRVEESTLWTIARWILLLRESLERTVPREIFVEKRTKYKIGIVTIRIGNDGLKTKIAWYLHFSPSDWFYNMSAH